MYTIRSDDSISDFGCDAFIQICFNQYNIHMYRTWQQIVESFRALKGVFEYRLRAFASVGLDDTLIERH